MRRPGARPTEARDYRPRPDVSNGSDLSGVAR